MPFANLDGDVRLPIASPLEPQHSVQPAAFSTARRPWPKTLPEQAQAVRAALAEHPAGLTAEAMARLFLRARTQTVTAPAQDPCLPRPGPRYWKRTGTCRPESAGVDQAVGWVSVAHDAQPTITRWVAPTASADPPYCPEAA